MNDGLRTEKHRFGTFCLYRASDSERMFPCVDLEILGGIFQDSSRSNTWITNKGLYQ